MSPSERAAQGAGSESRRRAWRKAALGAGLLAALAAPACGGGATGGTGGGATGTGTGAGSTGTGVACAPGSTTFCYTGPAGTEGIGICKAGTATCGADGAFGPCAGEVHPGTEDCATSEDENCDGKVNEAASGCICVPGTTMSCPYSGPSGSVNVGACKAATSTCNPAGLGFSACAGEVLPSPETCNTPVDDDCNGQVNEGGAGCVCVPGAMAACAYPGPAGTEKVGVCKAGTKTCDAMGLGFSACAGEVLPSPEKCGTPEDESCNGPAGLDGCGEHLWSKPFPSTATQKIEAMITDAAGNVILSGYFQDQVDLGGGPLTATYIDMFIAKLDATGKHLWSKRFGGAGQPLDELDSDGRSLAVDAAGNIYVTGSFTKNINFGAPLSNAGVVEGFLLKLDPSGAFLYAKDLGDANAFVGVDALGHPAIAGKLNGTASFGATQLVAAAGGSFFEARLDGNGNFTSAKIAGTDTAAATPIAMALDAAGNAYLTGSYNAAIQLGAAPLPTDGFGDVFLVKLDPTGVPLWSHGFAGGNNKFAYGVTVGAAGQALLAGWFQGSIDFGSNPLTSAGGSDAFVAAFETTKGVHVWSSRFGGPGDDEARDVALGAGGVSLVTGTFTGAVDFGDGPVQSLGGSDVFALKLDLGGGLPRWSKHWGDPLVQIGERAALDASGNALLAGTFAGKVDFGSGVVDSPGPYSFFVLKLAP